MDIVTFKAMVADALNRDLTALSTPTDKILNEANLAKAYAQRIWKFEHCRAQAQITVTSQGTLLTAATRYGGGSINIRNVEQPYLFTPDQQSLYPITLITRADQVEKIRRKIENVNPEVLTSNAFDGSLSERYFVQNGQTVFLWPYSVATLGASATVVMDVTEFLPEYGGAVTTDFFLTECVDWMKLKVMKAMSANLKDNVATVHVSDDELRLAWKAVETWDTAYVQSSVPLNID